MQKESRKYSKWFNPYNVIEGKTRCTFNYNNISGVYLIKEDNIVVYIGRSKKDLKATLYRHFQKWTDLRTNKESNYIARITYYDKNIFSYTIKVIICSNIEDVCALEEILIKALEPRDNKLKAKKYGYKYKEIVKSKFEEAGF